MKSFKEIFKIIKEEIDTKRNISGDSYSYNQEMNLFNSVTSCFEKNQDILWYPSAHNDFKDVVYFNKNRLEFLGDDSPIFFIHNDISPITYINLREEGYFFNYDFGNNYISKTFNLNKLEGDENKSITIASCSLGKGQLKYKINLHGFGNNEMLEMIIKEKIEIKYLYTTFTSGPGSENSIEPHYYLYFYDLLKTKFHIGIFIENFEAIDYQKNNVSNFLTTQSQEINKIVSSKLNQDIKEIIGKYKIVKVNTTDKTRFISNHFDMLSCRLIL
jgi:hypothetical protein